LDVLNLSIDRLRRIKAPFGVTLNDLVLATLAGAVGAYHLERGVRCDNLNCMVPTNLRSRDERNQLGNRVGVLNVVLPVGELDPELRLRNIVAQTTLAKSDHRGSLYPFVMEAISVVPVFAFRWVAKQSLGRVNIACTNVPGIGEPRRMAGAMVEAIYPFASVVEGTPLVVAMLSYAGRMDVGIDTDPEAIPDPHRIAELFEDELAVYERISTTAGTGLRSNS
jgi:WS/DGAT/MGAT family acyltransferase